MKILGWYSLVLLILGLMASIASDKGSSASSGKMKLFVLLAELPMIFYIAKTLNLL